MNFPSVNKPVSFLFMLVFAGIIWSGQYMVRDLWESDEARYTYVAQEMDQQHRISDYFFDSAIASTRSGSGMNV